MANLTPQRRRQLAGLVSYLQKPNNTAKEVYYTRKSGFFRLFGSRDIRGLGVVRLVKGLVVSKLIGWLVGGVLHRKETTHHVLDLLRLQKAPHLMHASDPACRLSLRAIQPRIASR